MKAICITSILQFNFSAITKVKDGWCKDEDQKRAEAQRKKLAEEEAKRIQHFLEEGKPI